MLYTIAVIALGGWGLLTGFRHGLLGQIPSLLGIAFGAVCVRAFQADAVEVVKSFFPFLAGHLGAEFIYSTAAAASLYALVYILFRSLTGVLRGAIAVFNFGVLDSLGGAALGALKYLLGLSLLFNCVACFNPGSVLVKSSADNDGNLLGAVMAIAPGVLGCLGSSDLALDLQLEEARKISWQPFETDKCSNDVAGTFQGYGPIAYSHVKSTQSSCPD